MILSEKDIFLFVFYPELIDEGKRVYIQNTGAFQDEILFYQKLRKQISVKHHNSFILKPSAPKIKKSGNVTRLAAATSDLVLKNEILTFSDLGSNYLCRILKTPEKSELYIISSDEKTDKHLLVTLYPSDYSFRVDDLNTPIELPPDIIIDQMKIIESGETL